MRSQPYTFAVETPATLPRANTAQLPLFRYLPFACHAWPPRTFSAFRQLYLTISSYLPMPSIIGCITATNRATLPLYAGSRCGFAYRTRGCHTCGRTVPLCTYAVHVYSAKPTLYIRLAAFLLTLLNLRRAARRQR